MGIIAQSNDAHCFIDQMKTKFIFILLMVLILAAMVSAGQAWHERQLARQQLAAQVANAKAPQTSITLIEGWNNRQIANYLQSKSITSPADFIALTKSFEISGYPILSGLPAGADLEGFIFPDTYFIPAIAPSGTDISTIIIQKALDNFSKKFTPDMEAQAKADNMSVFQIVTLASVIEKETGHSQTDRNTVAGIFYNRLKAGIALQSDATVSFFTGRADVTSADTQIDSPYNTFLYPGLPKGPICNPSLSSITAALYPSKTDYFYFLTDPQTGQVYYATTYQEHLQNKAKYLH